MTLAPNDLVYVSSPTGRSGEASYVRERRDGRHVVRWTSDGSEHVCRPADKLRPLERPPVSPGAIVRPYTVAGEHDAVRAVPKSSPVRSRSYLAWLRKQQCAWCLTSHGTREASHHVEPGHGSTSSKCSDLRALPLCPGQHRRFHDTARIGHLSPADTEAFVEAELAAHLTRYLRDECGWTAREINTRIVRLLSGLVDEEMHQRRAG